jgi:tRNA A-37 threonylcarbamoyl transferase component Bud32
MATVAPDSPVLGEGPSDAGTRVQYFGDYELLEEIARGGMGIVWKARQTSLKRHVAIKMIRNAALAGPDEVARFLREAEAAANLQHPNIVAIHEIGEHGGQHYFSMDYVVGRDLGSLVKDGPMAPRTAARYVKTIAEAVHFAHQRGTLHRDLKPQNVLIDSNDQPRITDFGLAKFMKDDSQMTRSGVIMGSPSYMPPEQAAGRHADIGPASDVYALGAMLYELLTGRPPFRGSTALATLHEVLETEPIAPRRLRADLPLDLETICLKCLEKTASARYATARGLAEELDRFLKSEPIHARPASAVRKIVSWTRRHLVVLAALAALVVVALGFSVFYLFEENAFLRAQQADPALTQRAGPRHEALEIWGEIACYVFLVGFALQFLLETWLRGVSVKERFDPKSAWHTRPVRPLGDWTRILVAGASLLFIGVGVMLLVKVIQAHVWEGEGIRFSHVAWIYCTLYLGLWTLGVIVRDYRLVHYGINYGSSSRRLTEEQIEPIRRALEQRSFAAAIKRYREAAPDASGSEAARFVLDLFNALRTQFPERFAPPPLSLATLNWQALLICALVEAIAVGVLWIVFPPSQPIAAVCEFAYSLLFGLGLVGTLRVKGYKKLLLLTPSVLLFVISVTVVAPLVAPLSGWSMSLGRFLFGLFCGMVLMLAAFKPRLRG